jgi:uncharacterized protein (TIGR02246 family)
MTDPTKARAAAETIAAALTTAWNEGDAEAFAAEFANDADFVNIFATHIVGREAIEKLHQTIFDTIYKDSTNEFIVEEVRPLGDRAALVHIRAEVQVPSGPLAGEVATVATVVIVHEHHDWRIAAFQNTRVQPQPNLSSD